MTFPLGLFVAFVGSTGWFGDFVMLVSFGVTMGTVVGAGVALIAERHGRRKAVSPWTDPPPIDYQRYAVVGALGGAAVGAVVGVLDFLLS